MSEVVFWAIIDVKIYNYPVYLAALLSILLYLQPILLLQRRIVRTDTPIMGRDVLSYTINLIPGQTPNKYANPINRMTGLSYCRLIPLILPVYAVAMKTTS